MLLLAHRPTARNLTFLFVFLLKRRSSIKAFTPVHPCGLVINQQGIRSSSVPSSATISTGVSPIGRSTSKRMVSNESTNRKDDGNDSKCSTTDDQLVFGKFKISSEQIFYNSPTNLSAAIVNLRPIVPGHVLIIPKRIVPKISQLTTAEYTDLWAAVRTVQNILEEHYATKDFNIAVQDGKAAGQSVPHVHVHILPRIANDFERNDDVYDKLEEWAPSDELATKKLQEKERNGNALNVPNDDDRKDRTMKEMEDEASIYRSLLRDSKL